VTTIDIIWFIFIFAFGCCIGSFLNVVIYRLPREKSLIFPPSACPACGRRIRFYDNIPLVSWLILGGKCRHCRARISPRYFIIELLTGIAFVGLFYFYFFTENYDAVESFTTNGWYIYLVSVILVACLIAASAIDLELWIIPISICWFLTGAGLAASTFAHYAIDSERIWGYDMFPAASPETGALAAGGLIGLFISLLLLATGKIKRSYAQLESDTSLTETSDQSAPNDRLEMLRELLFLLPVILSALIAYIMLTNIGSLERWWINISQMPPVTGFLGSLFGYFIGAGLIWTTRILGTLAFGKEAMGLGDVHLMGAAGTILGPLFIVFAFFIAPFLGLAWAVTQMFFKKTRQIPYGPFLSLGIVTVMILHDWIFVWWNRTWFQ